MDVKTKNKEVGMKWEMVRLGDILTITTGKYDVNHQDENGIYPFFTCAMLPFKSNTFSFDDEVILLPGNGANVGEVMYYHGKLEAYQRTYVLHKINADVKFVYYFLKLNWRRTQSNQQYGSATNYIRLDNITDLQIPLPPLPVQKRIAAILDTADALRRKDQELLKKYDELAQAIFIDMFGDPVRNEKGWDCFPVISYCDCIVPGRDKPKSFTGNIPWVTTDDLNHLSQTISSKKSIGLTINEIKFVKAKIIPVNSVIMTCVGDLGVVSINTQEIVINQQLHAFQCGSKMNPFFLMYNLSYQKDFMYKMSSSTTVPYMNKTVCNSIPVICPPIYLQNLFEDKINLLLEQKRKLNETKSNDLFQSLLQKAFKGEL